ncbi:hypothetical protein HNP84_008943 [Thermocatellispora tengchongensis]|uniref:LPXTG cell wall anchor domain-containing protein n=1 Tax=Thermocatellispora tengchongensis TaxID=1073253 RepID=A0A840PNA6_9ACTN|nr:hypothetical protein [Thermocatellispora tengchongensis]MBB5139180.1 hypothetical protein [Thermocatellispora tengchongensis]
MILPLFIRTCLGLALALAPAAAAHPFGPPSTARIGAEGSRVTISWLAAEDDWVALGQSLGAFEDPSSGAVSTQLTGEQKLARSPAVREYLLSRVAVTQAGRPCAAELAPLERLLAEGARFGFECPEPVTEVEVRIDALTDLNEAYRTVLTAETPATPDKAMLTAAADTQRVRFHPSPGGGVPLAAPIAALAGALAALAGVVLYRRRRPAGARG